jgi:hypothetical protein
MAMMAVMTTVVMIVVISIALLLSALGLDVSLEMM